MTEYLKEHMIARIFITKSLLGKETKWRADVCDNVHTGEVDATNKGIRKELQLQS